MELQLAELQRKLYALKVQQTADDVSHKSIVEALEAAAEEEQAVFVARVAELAEELERSWNESTSSQLKAEKSMGYLKEELLQTESIKTMFKRGCRVLESKLSKMKKQQSELCRTLIKEKEQQVILPHTLIRSSHL